MPWFCLTRVRYCTALVHWGEWWCPIEVQQWQLTIFRGFWNVWPFITTFQKKDNDHLMIFLLRKRQKQLLIVKRESRSPPCLLPAWSAFPLWSIMQMDVCYPCWLLLTIKLIMSAVITRYTLAGCKHKITGYMSKYVKNSILEVPWEITTYTCLLLVCKQETQQ